MRFDAFQSVVSCEASSALDYLLPLRPFCFQLTLAVFTPRPSPVPLRVRVHPLVCLPSLQSTWSFQTCLSTEVAKQPSPSFLPIRDINKENPLTSEFSNTHLRSALSVSHALDGLRLSLPWRLVSSSSHVQDSPFRGFARCPGRPPRRRSVPSCRCAPLVSPESCLPDSNSWSPAFRALLQTATRCQQPGV